MMSLLLDLNPLGLYLLGELQYEIYSNNPSTENNIKKVHKICLQFYQSNFNRGFLVSFESANPWEPFAEPSLNMVKRNAILVAVHEINFRGTSSDMAS